MFNIISPQKYFKIFKLIYIHVLLVCILFPSTVSAQKTQYCMLKADDFQYHVTNTKGIDPVYIRYIELIIEKGIVSGLGTQAKFWDIDEPLRSDHVDYINELKESGQFEFWNHGYTSSPTEFLGSPYSEQFASMEKAQNVIKEKLGVTMHTFGAGWNNIDITTTSVTYNVEDQKVWLYNANLPAPPGVLPLPVRTTVEKKIDNARHPISLEDFIQGYNPNAPYILCQLHPHRYHAEQDWIDLEIIFDYLIAEGVEFILPYDYYLLQANGLIADAGPDTTIGGSPATLDIGSSNTSDDADSYGWTTIDGHIVSGAKEKIVTIDEPGTYKLTVKRTGSLTITDAVTVTLDNTTSVEGIETIPEDFSMSVYPNPFNPTTTVNYTIPNDSKVVIEIYNSIGQKVSELMNENKSRGKHYINWNAVGISSGTYFARINTISLHKNESYGNVQKLLLLK